MLFQTKRMLLSFICVLFGGGVSAQAVDWATEIAPILYDHCVSCHRDGGIGGFSLIGYNAAYGMREGIADATSNRRMPPWKPDPNYRHFTGENYLNEAEINSIQQWLAADAPAGDMSLAPPEPTFITGSNVGIPDLILETPIFTITNPQDEYRCFVIPTGLATTAFMRGLEVIPGNHMAVHHVLIYQDTTGKARQLDQQTPEPGYVNFGGPGVQSANLIGAWVPGNRATLTPPFMGIRLKAGADLIVQVHFPAGAEGLTEQSTLNLFFNPTNQGIRELQITPALNHFPPSLQNGPLAIDANEVKEFHAKYTAFQNLSVFAIGPHMHLIGRSMKCYGVGFQGDTIPLIDIPEWDFHWQGYYTFQKMQKISLGTQIHAYATYDNTPNNPFNPSSPPQDVARGEATTDEMMLVYFVHTAYQPGDENIILDSTLLSSALPIIPLAPNPLGALQVYPNPVQAQVWVQYEVLEPTDVLLTITDATGRAIQSVPTRLQQSAGIHSETINLNGLAPGIYFVRMSTPAGASRAVQMLKIGE